METSEKDVVFFDAFDKPPTEPWAWIREDPDGHRSSEKGLEIKLAPGSLMGDGRGVGNILVRPLPVNAKFVSLRVEATHKNQYEQAGLILYVDDDNYIKLVLEMVDGKPWIVFVVEIEAQASVINKIPAPMGGIRIGLAFENETVTAFGSGEKEEQQKIGSARFPMKPRPKIGVFTHGGDPKADRWARFGNFWIYERVTE
ncbi:MAG: DUF1349 domain-containing protein [bacterium]